MACKAENISYQPFAEKFRQALPYWGLRLMLEHSWVLPHGPSTPSAVKQRARLCIRVAPALHPVTHTAGAQEGCEGLAPSRVLCFVSGNILSAS